MIVEQYRRKEGDPFRRTAVRSSCRISFLPTRSIDLRCLPFTMDSGFQANNMTVLGKTDGYQWLRNSRRARKS